MILAGLYYGGLLACDLGYLIMRATVASIKISHRSLLTFIISQPHSLLTNVPMMSNNTVRISVMISGSGTNLQALIDATKDDTLPNASIIRVISNRAKACKCNLILFSHANIWQTALNEPVMPVYPLHTVSLNFRLYYNGALTDL